MWYVPSASSVIMVRLNTGIGFAAATQWSSTNGSWGGAGYFGLADLNGDGKPDLWYGAIGQLGRSWSGSTRGIGFAAATQWSSTNGSWGGAGYFGLTDLNGDGKPDLWYVSSASSMIMVRLNTGIGFAAATQWSSTNGSWGGAGYFGFVDLNGDGKPDLWYVPSGSSLVNVRNLNPPFPDPDEQRN